jgi:hypothetical protein
MVAMACCALMMTVGRRALFQSTTHWPVRFDAAIVRLKVGLPAAATVGEMLFRMGGFLHCPAIGEEAIAIKRTDARYLIT